MIYLDLIFLLNFAYDFLLLLTVSVALKRNVKLIYIILSAVIGALSIFLFFLKFNYIQLLVVKILTSMLMSVVAFGYKNIKYTTTNIMYLYMCSVILAGFLYYLNTELTYSNVGLIFYDTGVNINYILLLIISPVILILYIYQTKKLKQKQNLSYKVKVTFKNNKTLTLDGFIDSGNKLKDPVTNKFVIIVNKKIYYNKNPIFVPFRGVNKKGVLECFSLKHIEINNQRFNNYLLGVSEEAINLDGSNCILNCKLLEDLNV